MLSVIIPAHNEAALIGPCLQAVLDSSGDLQIEIIVVANGCNDETVAIAQTYQKSAQLCNLPMQVLDLATGGKLAALNAGDASAKGTQQLYLDADVLVGPDLLGQIISALNCKQARYVSGTLIIPRPASKISRAYCAIYSRVPFMTHGVPGAGLFAMNTTGRARWAQWPDIISDDTYARLMFSPDERVKVTASYQWPIVEGWANLVAVRRRQNAGVDEIKARFPELLENDDTPDLGIMGKLKLALFNPVGFAVYSGVALTVRLTRPKDRGEWKRGR